jgi:adenylate cyclase
MGVEIERKFLVLSRDWRSVAMDSSTIRQGYLTGPDNQLSVRIRIVDDKAAYLTLKSRQRGCSREEYEYPIPLDDGRSLLQSATGSLIEKRRYLVMEGRTRWEIDEFEGVNSGLVVAEVELASETTAIERPSWLGQEITSDVRYGNAFLAAKPFGSW